MFSFIIIEGVYRVNIDQNEDFNHRLQKIGKITIEYNIDHAILTID